MTENSGILPSASRYVQEFMLQELPAGRLFHNFRHAAEVADVCGELAEMANLSDEQKQILQLAALFQDCGYTRQPDDVAAGSVSVASEFLMGKDYPEERLEKVVGLIESLYSKEEPVSDLERILHDANHSWLGRKRFFRRGRLLRLEKEKIEGKRYTLHEWNQRLLNMLVNHQFYTPWAQSNYSKRLNNNIVKQRRNINKAYEKTVRKKTGKDFGRGVDTLYRVTLRNHINISRIADGKANMIISVNTLVLSILITAGVAGFSLDELALTTNFVYAIPVIMLMLTSLSTIIFAVLSAMPKVGGEEFDETDIEQHNVSLLFFSNFLKLDRSTFVQHLRELKRDQEVLYDDLSRDLYNLGGVLKKKYRLLTIAYSIFVIGLVLSLLTFLALYFV